jgi:hypothetical protein
MTAMHLHDPIDAEEDLIFHTDDIDDVLAALRVLASKVVSPIVRGCLQDVHDEIAHLTSKSDDSVDVDEHLDVA